jgi:hypothetical protein
MRDISVKITRLVAAGSLALAVCIVQPATVFARPVVTPAATNAAGVVVPMIWAVGFFICTGLTWGKMQVDAQKQHRELTGADAFRGIGRCLFPPIGFAKLMQGK